MIGARISHFRIVEEIGKGGMGVVFRARDEDLQRIVALKVLRAEALGAPGRRERFRREARAASALNHPGIVVVHEVGSADDVDFIAMELVEGRTLGHAIPEGGLALDRFLGLSTQLAEALQRAHAAGILHRDLKPGNVMVTPEGRLKVLDFGLAKWLGGASAGPDASTQEHGVETADGIVVGTPRFMSPEQVNAAPLDERSDIFSFGAVVYQMLTGRPAFSGASAALVQSAILRDAPEPLGALRPELPAELERIIGKTLEKDAALRYQSMAEVLSDLRRLERDSKAPLDIGAAPARTAKRALVAGGVVLLLFVGLAVSAWWGRSSRPEHLAVFRLISTFPGSHRSPSFSPDGSMIAFTDAVGGVSQIWVKALADGSPVQITDVTAPARRPRWSPRGDQLVFVSDGSIWAVPPLGGAPTRIIENGGDPNFSRDGERIVFARGRGIWTARADGSDQKRVDGVPDNYYSAFARRAPAFSPDGLSIAFFLPANGPAGDLWILPLGSPIPRRLTHDEQPGGSPVFTGDGRHVVFASARGGGMNLWRVSLSDGSLEPVTTGSGDDIEPDISADGKLIYCNLRMSYALNVLDPTTRSKREIIEQRLPIAMPRISPDGKRAAFFGTVDDATHIFTIALDGSRLRQLTSGAKQRNIVPGWAGDGRRLYYYQTQPTTSLNQVSAEGGPASRLLSDWDWTRQNHAALDASGARVVYTEMDQALGASATRVRDLDTGRESVLSQPLWSPQWDPDGSRVLGMRRDGMLAWCPVRPGSCTTLVEGAAARLLPVQGRIYFMRNRRHLDDRALVSAEVASIDENGGDLKREATLDGMLAIAPSFDVTPNGEIVWVEVRRGASEMWLAEPARAAPGA